ncbi:MAG: aldo/keto reductase [Rubripirellula sp.]
MNQLDRKVTLGLWPIAGVTTLGVTDEDARATIQTAFDLGITAFDTAFSYGYDGESDRHLGSVLGSQRDQIHITGKVGQRWDGTARVIDGSPPTLTADAETSLERIGIDQFDLLMLHCPDPNVPIEQSAEAIEQLQRRGLCKQIGVCNVTAKQQQQFADAVGCDAIQCPLNLMQQASLEQLIPQCKQQSCDVFAFWVLMKGLLAGKIGRDHAFAAGDSRPNYEIFQGQQRRDAHDVLDAMQKIGDQAGMTIAQLSIGWVLSQEGVSGALIGARRPEQIRETAAAGELPKDVITAINRLVEQPSR